MKREVISTQKAPAAIGPYSQAVKLDNMVFTSGQIPLDPLTGKIIKEGIEAQTKQVLENLGAVLEAAGSGLPYVVKTTVFIRNMNDFALINKVYAEYFKDSYPARSTVEVSRLPMDAEVEIEAVAYIP